MTLLALTFRPTHLRRWLALVLSVALATGCTGLGLGIGAAVGSGYEGGPMLVPFEQERFEYRFGASIGDEIKLILKDGEAVEGTYRGVRAPTEEDRETYLLLSMNDGGRLAAPAPGQAPPRLVAVACRRVSRVEVGSGKHAWAIGMLVGALVDLGVIFSLSRARLHLFCC